MRKKTKESSKEKNQNHWKAAYTKCRELELQLEFQASSNGDFCYLLMKAISNPLDFKEKLKELKNIQSISHIQEELRNSGKSLVPPLELEKELLNIAELRSSYNPYSTGFLFEDVYHLAFHKIPFWKRYIPISRYANENLKLFRGQRRDDWAVGASIYKDLPKIGSRQSILETLASKAYELSSTIAIDLNIPFDEALAYAQHYKDIFKTDTWMLDFSCDPWIALYFATEKGEEKHTGIVWELNRSEWDKISSDENNPIGKTKLVLPQCSPRINNQAGVFLVAGIPEIFEQYVATGYMNRFRQRAGFIFEDYTLGITNSTIYPKNDQLLSRLVKIKVPDSNSISHQNNIPKQVFSSPTEPKIYEDLLNIWLKDFCSKNPSLPVRQRVESDLLKLAHFHALLQTPSYVSRIPCVTMRSIHRLENTFFKLCSDLYDSSLFRDTVYFSYLNYQREDCEAISDALNVVCAIPLRPISK